MHDSLGMHVLESQADLTEVLPDCLLGNQSTLPLEVLCAVVVVVFVVVCSCFCCCCVQLLLLCGYGDVSCVKIMLIFGEVMHCCVKKKVIMMVVIRKDDEDVFLQFA